MTIATYAELVTEVESFLNRADQTARIPTAIRLFEAWCNRELRLPQMEGVSTATTAADSESVPLPSNFRQVRSLHLDTDPIRVLEYMAPASMRSTYAANQTGKPLVYTIENEALALAPVPDDAYTLVLTYYATVPALTSTDTTNWLLTKHPDAYLAGTLAYMYALLRDNEESAKWQSFLDSIVASAVREGNRERIAGPIILRPAGFA